MSTELTAEELIAKGYRRTSNKYNMLARIDKPNWIEILEEHLDRKLTPRNGQEVINLADYYRRVLSADIITVDAEISRAVPNSRYDSIGYVEIS